MEFRRTNMCGDLRVENVGDSVVLMGWVAKKKESRISCIYRFKG